MIWTQILLVALGGGAGSVFRYLVGRMFPVAGPASFPYATLFVNISGCLLIGLFYGLSVKQDWMTPNMRLLLMTGLCGGFTTFSAFTLEGMNLLNNQQLVLFLLYFAISVVVGLSATFLGYWLIAKM